MSHSCNYLCITAAEHVCDCVGVKKTNSIECEFCKKVANDKLCDDCFEFIYYYVYEEERPEQDLENFGDLSEEEKDFSKEEKGLSEEEEVWGGESKEELLYKCPSCGRLTDDVVGWSGYCGQYCATSQQV